MENQRSPLGPGPPSQELLEAMETYDLHSPLPLLPNGDLLLAASPGPSPPSVNSRWTYSVVPLLTSKPSTAATSGKRLPGGPGIQHVPEVSGSFPLLEKYLGRFNFAASVSPNSKKLPTFSKELNTFFVQSQVNFAVEFDVVHNVPQPNLHIQVMVCYSDPTYLSEHGPIVPCSCNTHICNRKPEYGDKFIISTSRAASYSEKGGHKTVTIKLSDMQIMNGKYTAVFSYASYTSCVAKSTTKVATIFSLMDGEVEVGRDMFYCCVCACPPRDIVKAQMKLEGQTVSRSRKRKRKSTSEAQPLPTPLSPSTSSAVAASRFAPTPQIVPLNPPSELVRDSSNPLSLFATDPDMDIQPDEDGWYNFHWHWKLKDRETFYHLCMFKRSLLQLHERRGSHSTH